MFHLISGLAQITERYKEYNRRFTNLLQRLLAQLKWSSIFMCIITCTSETIYLAKSLENENGHVGDQN